MQYEKEKLANAKDFNLTCEYLDGWQVRYIIVSAKVRNISESINSHSDTFLPLRFSDPISGGIYLQFVSGGP